MCIPGISKTHLTKTQHWLTWRKLLHVLKTPHPNIWSSSTTIQYFLWESNIGCWLPWNISFESPTSDVGPLKKGVRFIDARHYNAYLILSRLIYILSTKLKGDVLHKRLGQQYEVKLIQFITRYGYATRPNPYCKLHRAYARYTDMHTPPTSIIVMMWTESFL